MSTRDRVLALLERHRGRSVSGEAMAAELDISRAAVWKAVQELRGAGYRILAVNRKGYCLSEENDILSSPGIRQYLNEGALAYADRISVYPALPSTNQTAKELALAGAPHGTAVIADAQTAGHGRYARPFFSPAGGGLYISLILRPEALPWKNPTLITAFAAVAVCRAIEAVSDRRPGIKWVNDVLIDGKKAAGILTEAAADFESGALSWIVLGVGVNVRVAPGEFPEELRDTAVSVFPDGAASGVRNRLAAALLNGILGGPLPGERDVLSAYKSRLTMLGREVTVFRGGESFSAFAQDIDGQGRLIVRTAAGETLALTAGEISVRG